MTPHQFVESSNLKQFFIGVVICSLGAFLTYGMLESTSWTTYSDADKGSYQGEFGQNTYEYDVQQDIGLHHISPCWEFQVRRHFSDFVQFLISDFAQ